MAHRWLWHEDLDWCPENLLYDREDGFSAIDNYVGGDSSGDSVAKEVMRLRRMLVGKRYKEFEYRDTAEYSQKSTAQNQERRRESLDLGLRILRIVKERFPDIFDVYKQSDSAELLKLGDSSESAEFDPGKEYDQHILQEALRILDKET